MDSILQGWDLVVLVLYFLVIIGVAAWVAL